MEYQEAQKKNYTIGVTYCMVCPCVRDDWPRAVSEWPSFVHTGDPYNKLRIAFKHPAPCASPSLYLNLNGLLVTRQTDNTSPEYLTLNTYRVQ